MIAFSCAFNCLLLDKTKLSFRKVLPYKSYLNALQHCNLMGQFTMLGQDVKSLCFHYFLLIFILLFRTHFRKWLFSWYFKELFLLLFSRCLSKKTVLNYKFKTALWFLQLVQSSTQALMSLCDFSSGNQTLLYNFVICFFKIEIYI